MAAQELFLTAVHAGAENIPDSFLDRIPGFRPPKEERERRKSEKARQERRASQDADDYARYSSKPSKSRSGSTSDYPPSAASRYRRDEDPGPRRRGSASATSGAAAAASARRRSDTSSLNPTSLNTLQNQYNSPLDDTQPVPPHLNSSSLQAARGTPVMASYNDYEPRRYNPQDYVPQQEYQGYQRGEGYSPVPYERDSRARPVSSGPYDRRSSYRNSEDYRDDEYYDEDNDSRRSRRREKSRSRHDGPRSKSRIDRVKEKFDPSERGLGSGALGAVAGGLVGHEVGKGIIPTIAGVVLGGLAANAWEARDARHKGREHDRYKERRHGDSRRTRSTGDRYSDVVDSRTRRDLDRFDRDRDSRREVYSDEDDDGDSYDERRRRRRDSRRGGMDKETRDDHEKAFKWKEMTG